MIKKAFCLSADEEGFPAPAGPLQVQEVLQELPAGPGSAHPHPGPVPWLSPPAEFLAASSCRSDHPGLHQGHDCQTTLPEAQGRGKKFLYLLLLPLLCGLWAGERGLLLLNAGNWGKWKKGGKTVMRHKLELTNLKGGGSKALTHISCKAVIRQEAFYLILGYKAQPWELPVTQKTRAQKVQGTKPHSGCCAPQIHLQFVSRFQVN